MNQSLERAFDYEGSKVRTVVMDGEPWFVASEVCAVLDIDTSVSVNGQWRRYPDGRVERSGGLDDDEKGTHIVSTPGGPQEVLVVSEAGLYSLIMKSRKPEAKAFKRWITHEVIPAIRKTGSYSTTPQFDIPKNYAEALRLAANLWEENQEQKAALIVMAPKADFYEAVAASRGSQSFRDAAKVFGTGQNRLFAQLRNEGILMEDNRPYQQYVDAGYFVVVERTFTDWAGNQHLTTQTRITGKGLIWLQKRFQAKSLSREAMK